MYTGNSREYQSRSFFDDEDAPRNGRSDVNCPDDYQCTKLQGKPQSVCCPLPSKSDHEDILDIDLDRKQSSKPTQIFNSINCRVTF